MKDLTALSASDGIQKVKRGELSAVDWMSACADRIEALDSNLHAWVYFNKEQALERARAVDEKIAQARKANKIGAIGELAGLPVGVKDIFNTADMPTCMGSPIWEGFTPGNDGRVVFNLRHEDAVLAGKTVTAEFAVHAPGKTRNPHHPDFSPGTSSSGSATAVGARMVPVALGTQTAGSIMRPASYCGVLGFKPSFGLLPRTGVLKTTDSLDTIGFFANYVADLQLLFNVCRVRGEDYPISERLLNDPIRQSPRDKRWKVGLVTSSLNVWTKASAYAQEKIANLAKQFAKEGMDVEEVRVPDSLNTAHQVHGVIYDKTLAYYFRDEFRQHTLVSKVMYEIIQRGSNISVPEYQQALEKQASMARELDQFLERYDALLTLTTAGQAPKWGEDDILDSCLIWTLCGNPVINLPLFKSPSGMPFGAQIVTRRYQDFLLLKFACEIEARLPFTNAVSSPVMATAKA